MAFPIIFPTTVERFRSLGLALSAATLAYSIVLTDGLQAGNLQLESGDRIVFAGDSITDAKKWTHYLASYLILANPDKLLHIQTEGRGGTTVASYLSTAIPNPDYEQYPKMVLPYRPRFVFTMFGHNGSATPQEHRADYQSLIDNFIRSSHGLADYSGAIPVLIGPHPKASSDGKPSLGAYENELGALARERGYEFSPTWNSLLPTWTNAENRLLIGGNDEIHPGTAGHIAIAYSIAKNLSWDREVSSVKIEKNTAKATDLTNCTVTSIAVNQSGGVDFERLDRRLPWAIDEAGRSDAWQLLPEIKGWQKYMLAVSGLADGTYDVLIDGVDVADVTAAEFAQGWNMANLSMGPVWEQCQEVLNRIRDMHGVDRDTLARKGTPWEGVEKYKSSVASNYKNGLRGQALIDSQAGNLDLISQLDQLIHEAAQPKVRRFSIRLQKGNSETTAEFSPPTGIPDPRWSETFHPIDVTKPVLPLDWSGTSALGCYYVDSSHSQAADTNNPNGSPNLPRLTVPLTLAAGSRVFIADCQTQVVLKNAIGTADQPIWLVGTGNATIRISATGKSIIISGSSSYVMVDGLTMDGSGAPDTSGSGGFSITDGAHHVSIRNCAVKNYPAPPYNPTRFSSGGSGTWYQSINGVSSDSGNVSDVVIYKLDCVGNAGGQELDYESGRHAVLITGNGEGIYSTKNIWILDSELINNPEDGIQVGKTSSNSVQTACSNIYIGRNVISRNGENAIDLKSCDKVVVSQNVMQGYKSTAYREGAVSGSDGSACVINDDGKGPLESWWLFNHIFECRGGIRNQALTGNHYIVGNMVHQMQLSEGDAPTSGGYSRGTFYWQGTRGCDVFLVNNTVFDVEGGFYLANVKNAHVWGNIVCGIRNNGVGYPLTIGNSASISVGQNLYFDPDAPVRRDADALSIEKGDQIDVDPKLMDPPSDMSLAASSLARGTTTAALVYDTYETTFGVSIRFDAFGNPFPSSAPWHAGAVQGKSVPSPSLSRPTGLRVIVK